MMWPRCAGTASVSGTKRRKIGTDAQPPSAEQEAILWTVNMEECRVKLRQEMRPTLLSVLALPKSIPMQGEVGSLQGAARHWLYTRQL